MTYPKQEYWSGLPLPSTGDLPDPGSGSKRATSNKIHKTCKKQEYDPYTGKMKLVTIQEEAQTLDLLDKNSTSTI